MKSLQGPLAKLSTEDLNRWRMARARLRSMELRPQNYNRQEMEVAFIDEWRMVAEFIEKYEIDPSLSLAIYTETGLIEEEV